jgi:hypothetical protein
MYAEVQHYIDAEAEAASKLQTDQNEIGTRYPNRHALGRDAAEEYRGYSRELDAVYEVYKIARNTAWQGLKESTDPLVRWIAEHCKDYQGEAIAILRALPASLEDLDTIAYDASWCGVWGEFRERAEAAGVLPGMTPPVPLTTQQAALMHYITYNITNNRRTVAEIQRRMLLVAEEAAGNHGVDPAPVDDGIVKADPEPVDPGSDPTVFGPTSH